MSYKINNLDKCNWAKGVTPYTLQAYSISNDSARSLLQMRDFTVLVDTFGVCRVDDNQGVRWCLKDEWLVPVPVLRAGDVCNWAKGVTVDDLEAIGIPPQEAVCLLRQEDFRLEFADRHGVQVDGWAIYLHMVTKGCRKPEVPPPESLRYPIVIAGIRAFIEVRSAEDATDIFRWLRGHENCS